MRGRRVALLWAALAVCTLVVLVIVLYPNRPAGAEQESLRRWIKLAHERWLPQFVTFGRVEWLANVVMFVPLGFLGRLAFPRYFMVLAALVLLSVSIECFQHFLLTQRVGSAADVIANSTGAGLGVLAASAALRLQRRLRSQVRSR